MYKSKLDQEIAELEQQIEDGYARIRRTWQIVFAINLISFVAILILLLANNPHI